MPLILQPTFNDKSREEIETHLMAVRARRMLAVAVYYQGINAKATASMAKEQARMQREYGLLLRDIGKLDKIAETIEARLVKVEEYLSGIRLAEAEMVEVEDGERDDEERETNEEQRATRPAFESNRTGRSAPSSRPYRGWEKPR